MPAAGIWAIGAAIGDMTSCYRVVIRLICAILLYADNKRSFYDLVHVAPDSVQNIAKNRV